MPKVNKKAEKGDPIGVRLTVEQLARIDKIVEKSRRETGFDVSRQDVIRKLVDAGLAKVEK